MPKIIRTIRYLRGISVALSILVTSVGCTAGIEAIPTPTIGSQMTPELVSPAVTSSTPSRTSSSVPSLTPEPSETPYPPSQLSKQEKKSIIANFVRTNNQCTLPCFMGVELQRSTLDEIEALFSPSMGPGLITRKQSTDEVVYGSGFETNNLIRGDFGIHLHEGKTDGIDLLLLGLWRPGVSMEDWEPYTLKGIFSQLGPPTRIVINKQGPPSESSDQGMIVHYSLIYETIDTIIAYHGQKTDDVPKYHFCPMQQKPEFIGISIGSYTKDISVTGTDLAGISKFSVKEFYNKDWSNPDTCIDLDIAVLKSHP